MRPALQVAGHPGAQQGNGLFLKPTCEQEIAFYQALLDRNCPLVAVVPQFMGTLIQGVQPSHDQALAQQAEKLTAGSQLPQDSVCDREMSPELANVNPKQVLVLEDELAYYHAPSILDVKLGSVLWDEQTPVSKRERLQKVRDTTTSGTLGFRIAGMSVVERNGERRQYGKSFGRGATQDNIQDHLKEYFNKKGPLAQRVVLGVVEDLRDIRALLEEFPVEMHSASVLVIYESDDAVLSRNLDLDRTREATVHEDTDSQSDSEDEPERDGTWTVKLIDFAHTKFAEEPYQDVLWGLDNLIRILQDLVHSWKATSTSPHNNE